MSQPPTPDRLAGDSRLSSGSAGIGPDRMSYGFALQTNPKRTPFGSAHYSYDALGGGWYSFAVSNDYSSGEHH